MAINKTPKNKKAQGGDSSSKAKSDMLKPFRCNECDATFGRKADCQRHWNTKHDPDRKLRELVCPWLGCDKTFSQKSNFEDHYKTHIPRHLAQRPCPFSKTCPFLWVTRSALSKHKKESHGKDAVKITRSPDSRYASVAPECISRAPSPVPSISTSSDRPVSQSVLMRPLLPKPSKPDSLPLTVVPHSHGLTGPASGYSPTSSLSSTSFTSYSPELSSVSARRFPYPSPVCTSNPAVDLHRAEPSSAPSHRTQFPYLPPPSSYPRNLHSSNATSPITASHREEILASRHSQLLPSPHHLLALHQRSSSSERYNQHHLGHHHHHPYAHTSPLSPLGLVHRSSAPHLRGSGATTPRFTASLVNETRRLPPPLTSSADFAGGAHVKLETQDDEDYRGLGIDVGIDRGFGPRSYSPTFSYERESRYSGRSSYDYDSHRDSDRPSSSHTLSSITSNYSCYHGVGSRTIDTARTSISPGPIPGLSTALRSGGPPRSASPSVNSECCNDHDCEAEYDGRPRSAGMGMSVRYRERDEETLRRPSSSGNIPTGSRHSSLRDDVSPSSSRLPPLRFNADGGSGMSRSWSNIVLGPSPGSGETSQATSDDTVQQTNKDEQDTTAASTDVGNQHEGTDSEGDAEGEMDY